jgi:glycine cleavage system transcriptional repressor
MSPYIVMTAVGPDRPGLVDEISEFLAARKINIEDSRMSVLGGEFAVILLASGVKALCDCLVPEITGLEKKTGLRIMIKETRSPLDRRSAPSIPHRLTATCLDHPGIVHEITQILHKRNINIESLETRVSYAPVSGAPIFNMKCVMSVPTGERLSSVRKELEKLGDRLDIDIEIEAVETYA